MLPYITPDLPGVGGVLRSTLDDFVVEEIPLYEPAGAGTHLYLNLTRSEMTTRDLVALLARVLHLRESEIGYAGLKDKYARSTQTFSIPVKQGIDAATIETKVTQVEAALPAEKQARINWSRLHGNKLRIGHLLGNRFTIVVSDLAVPPDEALARAHAVADAIRAGGVPNYFGAQRFGGQGDNALAGYEVVKGTRRVRDRWLRRFFVASYQSHLCNLYLARRVAQGTFGRILAGDIAKKHATGGVFVVEDAAVDQERFDARELSFTAPMYGFKMKHAQAEAALLEEEIAAETGITDAEWRAVHSEGARRMGRLLSDGLTVENHARGIMLRFLLPKGSFATTILREFMKGEGATLPPQEIDEQTE